MILPQKHVKMSESIFGLSATILEVIDKPISFDNLWAKFQKANDTNSFPVRHTLDNFILALNFLFIIGAICEGKGGVILLCS